MGFLGAWIRTRKAQMGDLEGPSQDFFWPPKAPSFFPMTHLGLSWSNSDPQKTQPSLNQAPTKPPKTPSFEYLAVPI